MAESGLALLAHHLAGLGVRKATGGLYVCCKGGQVTGIRARYRVPCDGQAPALVVAKMLSTLGAQVQEIVIELVDGAPTDTIQIEVYIPAPPASERKAPCAPRNN